MKQIFDSHAHYDDEAFDSDRYQLLETLFHSNVCGIINSSSDLESAQKAIALSHKYPHMWCTVGIHPQNASYVPKNYLAEIKNLLRDPKVLAIGEIGLDYHYDINTKNTQISIFEQQLNLAIEEDIPVVIHDRDAHQDTLTLLKKYHPKGVVHCFSGSVEMAKEIINLGMYISLGGVVTFKNAKHSPAVAREIPLEYLLLETDAPYMAPTPFRGKRCDSSYILFTAEKIAQIRNISVDTILDQTKKNAYDIFQIT